MFWGWGCHWDWVQWCFSTCLECGCTPNHYGRQANSGFCHWFRWFGCVFPASCCSSCCLQFGGGWLESCPLRSLAGDSKLVGVWPAGGHECQHSSTGCPLGSECLGCPSTVQTVVYTKCTGCPAVDKWSPSCSGKCQQSRWPNCQCLPVTTLSRPCNGLLLFSNAGRCPTSIWKCSYILCFPSSSVDPGSSSGHSSWCVLLSPGWSLPSHSSCGCCGLTSTFDKIS